MYVPVFIRCPLGPAPDAHPPLIARLAAPRSLPGRAPRAKHWISPAFIMTSRTQTIWRNRFVTMYYLYTDSFKRHFHTDFKYFLHWFHFVYTDHLIVLTSVPWTLKIFKISVDWVYQQIIFDKSRYCTWKNDLLYVSMHSYQFVNFIEAPLCLFKFVNMKNTAFLAFNCKFTNDFLWCTNVRFV